MSKKIRRLRQLADLAEQNKNKMSLAKNQVNCFNFEQAGLPAGQAGWKHYNTNIIRKKAVEQEFSWSGLLISLSIAFFIVIVSASVLNFINHSIAIGHPAADIVRR